ncbi:PhzF family phenazine biosynthesis protein [Lentilactobacillus hilgardii]|jgi:PhzF family phenazine biosynthesis protein|uniref:PhzF family phenazine biosynthesis isomerase n=1 Tax=Lentilactobacillus hilgardii TaxID=1588 RepID=A0A6P1E503_LENHI|nr:PhzF family phenazine biosynthesis protein [Lentilactobacillus hilgardii]EEI71440.1 phenazine biosynthesis protein, PhzF family [Lentilactobacillus hilgardii ATCC 27305]MCT3392052.1 PhzF family phenazine biosynthesis protein [Lentilactobacillus hilgardii]QHB51629.1 PhzF family phenazine biosynthesis isomerase [Lentilactobacillus hilgardii]RRG12378.1 MAG: PhzF family phenazine biosynthesis protein [Lactobacillus sp.]
MKSYIVDAFTNQIFKGNPAAVCILDSWPENDLMQKIAMENNLSETAFCVKENTGYRLRWFTPGGEIDLCGHATLATGYVIMNFIEKDRTRVTFETLSGRLEVAKNGDLYEMNFPSYDLKPVAVTQEMTDAIGTKPLAAYMARDLVCVLDSPDQVINAKPDLEKVRQLDGLLLHITALGEKYDSVSRSFAPKLAVDEDPVCGSGHCHLVPYWAKRLNKNKITAYQASKRSGILYCEYQGARTILSGKAALYSIGEVYA